MRGGLIEPREVHLLPRLPHFTDSFQANGDSNRMDVPGMQPTIGGFRMRKPKAIRAFSLDIDVISMLEKFAAAHDTWGKKKSRSKIVNDAIRYHITGGYADKLDSLETLQANFTRVCQDKAELEKKLRDQDRFDLN